MRSMWKKKSWARGKVATIANTVHTTWPLDFSPLCRSLRKLIGIYKKKCRTPTTTITNDTNEKLLPNLVAISTWNLFLSMKQEMSTSIPVDHCRISCNIPQKKNHNQLYSRKWEKLWEQFRCLPGGEQIPWGWKISGNSFSRRNCWSTAEKNIIRRDKGRECSIICNLGQKQIPCNGDRIDQRTCHRHDNACYTYSPAMRV